MHHGERESLGSRLGFLFISAGCAIGLGNVWRFPYITGAHGGGAFVILYLLFLVFLALPIMVMEFAVGRASQQNIGGSFRKLEPPGTHWHLHGYTGIVGNYLLMMFYTTVAGWMMAYCYYTASGRLAGLTADGVDAFFGATLGNPGVQVGWMVVVTVIGMAVCYIGLRRGVETVAKVMMSGLFILLVALAIRAVTLPGAEAGISFYLKPDWNRLVDSGLWTSVYAAMGQAFFTLSIGIGSMAIFGSYIPRNYSLTTESVTVMILDLVAALLAGLVIFPACFAYNVNPGGGPGLVFVTLPNVFNNMDGGRLWGFLFFLFMTFAALTTVIAVFENIVSYAIDVWHFSRKKSVLLNAVLMLILGLPCALGPNLLASWQPLGPGTGVLDLEDFILSNNILPLGSLVYLLFCTSRYGWGWDNFIAEADMGKGRKFPQRMRWYFTYVLPLIVLLIFVQGYIEKFFS
ncbi:MAG: sodium-dependent transporter [Planctomycetaceae bacterium]|nr:sodium-dependent transporter [Planctomycetaceae bacterium]